MITYEGNKKQIGHCPVAIYEDGKFLSHLKHRFIEHSPDGFQWGYEGSGPADLALNMLVDHLMRKGATAKQARDMVGDLYLEFKRSFIALMPAKLIIRSEEINDWLKGQ